MERFAIYGLWFLLLVALKLPLFNATQYVPTVGYSFPEILSCDANLYFIWIQQVRFFFLVCAMYYAKSVIYIAIKFWFLS